MNHFSPILVINQTCVKTMQWVTDLIHSAGMKLLCTFDLQVARQKHFECVCPEYVEKPCNCQMMVFMIYQANNPPISLVGYGNAHQTALYVIDTRERNPDPHMLEKLRHLLSQDVPVDYQA